MDSEERKTKRELRKAKEKYLNAKLAGYAAYYTPESEKVSLKCVICNKTLRPNNKTMRVIEGKRAICGTHKTKQFRE